MQYECDELESNDTCWVVDAAPSPLAAHHDVHYIRTSMDALVPTKNLCQTESAVPPPPSCAESIGTATVTCFLELEARTRGRRIASALPVISSRLIEQQRSQCATLTAGRLQAYLSPSVRRRSSFVLIT
jgi:hypothetical protein